MHALSYFGLIVTANAESGDAEADFVYACPLCAHVVCSSQTELEEHMISCLHKPAEVVAIADDEAAEIVQSTNIIEQQELQEFVIQPTDRG